MSLFKTEPSTILKDARWLQPLSDPPCGKPVCRDSELRTIAALMSELFRSGQARNLFIYGKPGTGKTLCIRYLLDEISKYAVEFNSPILTTFVNAGKTRTPYYTMVDILKGLGITVPAAGWQMLRLKQCFEQLTHNRSIVIAIDEVDSIIFKEKEPLVYYLNRQPKTTLILISNRLEDAVQLPERALSTLQPRFMRLEPYTAKEAAKILHERVKQAFQPNVITDRQLDEIAKTTAEKGDIRLGFHVLLTAALLAEKAGKTGIEVEDVQAGVEDETKLGILREIDRIKKQIENRRKRRENRLLQR
jgi:cell division control protein 6